MSQAPRSPRAPREGRRPNYRVRKALLLLYVELRWLKQCEGGVAGESHGAHQADADRPQADAARRKTLRDERAPCRERTLRHLLARRECLRKARECRWETKRWRRRLETQPLDRRLLRWAKGLELKLETFATGKGFGESASLYLSGPLFAARHLCCVVESYFRDDVREDAPAEAALVVG